MRDGEPTHFVWYVEPFGSDTATRRPWPEGKKKKTETDPELLRSEGFAALKGSADRLASAPTTPTYSRMSIYAPEPSKYFGSFRMLAFQPSDSLTPPPWVPVISRVAS